MTEFLTYDMSFLILFTLFIIIFLYSKRKNLKREGILFLYRTKIGIKTINFIGDKFKKTLHVLKYFAVVSGFGLMIGIFYLIISSVYIYFKFPEITQIIKAPPVFPLIPYFPQIFGVQSLFPPFYFTYFLLAIIIVAVSHEFAHGVFMRLFKIKIKSTGFVFLGPILGAFVEEDKKNFGKKKNFEQMAVLSAGTFANLLCALIFIFLFIGFFYLFFQPGGYAFNTYSYSLIPAGMISGIGNSSGNLTEIFAGNKTYLVDSELKEQLGENATYYLVYDDTPAARSGMKGMITSINGERIRNQKDLENFLLQKKPGDVIEIKTIFNDEEKSYTITLAENPSDKLRAYIGIGFLQPSSSGVLKYFGKYLTIIQKPSVYGYTPKIESKNIYLVNNFFYWIILINFFVALFNMLPLGILDGGRFFYLSVLSITKSKKIAISSFKLISYLIGLIFILLIIGWFIAL